jgi:thiol-disulfide isomerase/thioredoxin
MHSYSRAVLVFGCLTASALSATGDWPAPFQRLSFPAASELAQKAEKLVFVDFYTTWCEPCKKLDAETFSQAGVARLVGDAAVAIKLDAEKEGKDIARRYKVSAYPTLLLVRPDGVEVDRIIGFRDPVAFTRDFKKIAALAAAGTTGLEAARKQVERTPESPQSQGEPEEAQPHLELARKLIAAGSHEEALRELLWCWDEGKKDPEFARTRSTSVAREFGRLARSYPPVRDAMIVRRDQARERAIANKGGAVVVQDLIQLNRELKMDDDTIAVFDQMPEGDRRKVTISIYLFDVFLEKQRYADAMLFNMPESFTMNIERSKAQLKAGKQVMPGLQFTVTSTAKRIEALAGAGLIDQARDLGEKLLELDASAETKALLNRHVARAGTPGLFTSPAVAP